MCSMDIEHVETGLLNPASAFAIGFDQPLDFVDGHRARLVPSRDAAAGAGAYRLPRLFALAPPPRLRGVQALPTGADATDFGPA